MGKKLYKVRSAADGGVEVLPKSMLLDAEKFKMSVHTDGAIQGLEVRSDILHSEFYIHWTDLKNQFN